MTYVPNVPEAEPSPINTQPQIQTNFSQYATIFAENHTAINNSKQGDHEAIIFEKQTSDPGVTQDLVALYCKNAVSKVGTQTQLFAQIKKFLPTSLDTTNAENTPMQLTYNQVNTSGPQYQSFLIGGLLLFFGSTNNIAATITLSPSPSAILMAIAIPSNLHAGTPNNVSTTSTQPNQIKINSISSIGGDVFYWIAIGLV